MIIFLNNFCLTFYQLPWVRNQGGHKVNNYISNENNVHERVYDEPKQNLLTTELSYIIKNLTEVIFIQIEYGLYKEIP